MESCERATFEQGPAAFEIDQSGAKWLGAIPLVRGFKINAWGHA